MGDEERNAYIADPENLHEMARLIEQDRVMSRAIGNLFEDQWGTFEHILDIGCGPGGWVLDMAHLYPENQLIGIDISKTMINHANMLVEAEKIKNARFQVMDATKWPLEFPDQSFGFINLRFASSFLPPPQWPEFLHECSRLLKSRGTICITEYEQTYSNSASFDRLAEILPKALFEAKRSFSSSGRSIGMSYMLKPLLKKAGFQNLHHAGIAVDCSSEELREWAKENLVLSSYNFLPFILKNTTVTTEEEVKRLIAQTLEDIASPEYGAFSYHISAWGRKP